MIFKGEAKIASIFFHFLFGRFIHPSEEALICNEIIKNKKLNPTTVYNIVT